MSTSKKQRPLRVFISYTHRDRILKDELREHLAPLRRAGLLADWHDRDITAGQEWKGEINENLERAQVVLLLISSGFLNSAYCMDIEMQRAMERHDEGKARVIPIIIRPCRWQSSAFARLQLTPTDARPVTRWRSHDEGWLVVVQDIERSANQFRSSTTAERKRQNKQITASADNQTSSTGARKADRPPATKPSTPATPAQSQSPRTVRAQPKKAPAALHVPPQPVDSARLSQRAHSLIEKSRSGFYGNGRLQVIVVGGPQRQILSPSQIEEEKLAADLEQAALYRSSRFLVRGEKHTTAVTKGVLTISQEEASLSVAEDGAMVIVQPARRESPSQGYGFAALIEEDVLASIERALRFAGVVLARIDKGKLLTDLVVVAALSEVGHAAWRTRAEQAASPNSGFLGRGNDHNVVELRRTLSRTNLTRQIPAAARDLMTLLRREVKG